MALGLNLCAARLTSLIGAILMIAVLCAETYSGPGIEACMLFTDYVCPLQL